MKTVAIANQKGGVGKTTVSRNLAFYAIERGLRTLCIDLDPQKNFSKTLLNYRTENGYDDTDEHWLNASDLFSPKKAGKLRPMPCADGVALVAADRALVDVAGLKLDRLFSPREVLASLADEFDICIIDTAPTLGNPLYAALIASDFVVCPCTVDQDATDGLTDLFEDISRVQQTGWNEGLMPLGVLVNCVNSRRRFDLQGLEELRAGLGDLCLDTVLYERAAIKYAKEKPVWRATRGESHLTAAREMKAACQLILDKASIA